MPERVIQMLEGHWAHRHAYRTSAIRAASLRPWVTHYNHQPLHRAVGKIPPIAPPVPHVSDLIGSHN